MRARRRPTSSRCRSQRRAAQRATYLGVDLRDPARDLRQLLGAAGSDGRGARARSSPAGGLATHLPWPRRGAGGGALDRGGAGPFHRTARHRPGRRAQRRRPPGRRGGSHRAGGAARLRRARRSGRAFDQMVAELSEARSRLGYMQKLAAWQEVARRLAHEIKNPLTPIQLAVQELASKYRGGDPTLRETAGNGAGDPHRRGRRHPSPGRRFLGVRQAPQGRARPVDLGQVVDDFSRAHPEWQKALQVERRGPVGALCDRMLIRRVLANLVENGVQAAEAAGREPTVQIALAEGDSAASLFVDDNGPGVASDARERIFDPYMTTKEHGTGLGLAIVRKKSCSTTAATCGSRRLRRRWAARASSSLCRSSARRDSTVCPATRNAGCPPGVSVTARPAPQRSTSRAVPPADRRGPRPAGFRRRRRSASFGSSASSAPSETASQIVPAGSFRAARATSGVSSTSR